MVLRSEAAIGNTNLGASNDARELEGWLKAGTGDDKTDIVVIADFYDRAAIYSRDRDITSNAFAIPGVGLIFAVGFFPAGLEAVPLDPEDCFSARTLRHRTQRPTSRLLHFTRIHL